MNEPKLSERMQEVIDLYKETQGLIDPIWVQFQDEVAALEAENEDLKARLGLARAAIWNLAHGAYSGREYANQILVETVAAQQERDMSRDTDRQEKMAIEKFEQGN